MPWIKTISYQDAAGKLKSLYDRVKGPDNYIDAILLVHGLRPHTLTGHMSLYKNVLHHRENVLDKWFLESIGILVSSLNSCEYCVAHHYAGLQRLLDDPSQAAAIRDAVETNRYETAFDPPQVVVMQYVQLLTDSPDQITAAHVQALRDAGYDDGMILEINQVASYFAYANRTVLGLGVSLENDILGMSPGDASDENNWSHN